MLLELTLHALERPDAQQFAIGQGVSEWVGGRDFSPDTRCRELRTSLLARLAEIEQAGVPDRRLGKRTGDNKRK